MTKHLMLATATLLFTLPAFADDEYDHYKGEPSKTLEQAVANFSEYNNRLEQVLAGDLTLTYTLENALGKLDHELEDIAERLEKVHKASEHAAPDTVKEQGAVYLEKSRSIIR